MIITWVFSRIRHLSIYVFTGVLAGIIGFSFTLWNTRFCSLYIIVFFCPFFQQLRFRRFRAKLTPPCCGAKSEALLVIVFTWGFLNSAFFLRIRDAQTKPAPDRSLCYRGAVSGCWRAGNRRLLVEVPCGCQPCYQAFPRVILWAG